MKIYKCYIIFIINNLEIHKLGNVIKVNYFLHSRQTCEKYPQKMVLYLPISPPPKTNNKNNHDI